MSPQDERRVADALGKLQVDLADRLARIETKLDGVQVLDARLRAVEFSIVTRAEVEQIVQQGRKLSWRDLGILATTACVVGGSAAAVGARLAG